MQRVDIAIPPRDAARVPAEASRWDDGTHFREPRTARSISVLFAVRAPPSSHATVDIASGNGDLVAGFIGPRCRSAIADRRVDEAGVTAGARARKAFPEPPTPTHLRIVHARAAYQRRARRSPCTTLPPTLVSSLGFLVRIRFLAPRSGSEQDCGRHHLVSLSSACARRLLPCPTSPLPSDCQTLERQQRRPTSQRAIVYGI